MGGQYELPFKVLMQVLEDNFAIQMFTIFGLGGPEVNQVYNFTDVSGGL